jgi:hypothetical protein
MTLSKANKIGLALAFVMGVLDIVVIPTTPKDQPGPPMPVMILDTILGVITVVAVVIAWRSHSHGAIRITAGARILSMLTALPAFFVDGVPNPVRLLVAAFVVVTVLTVALLLSPSKAALPR